MYNNTHFNGQIQLQPG